MSLESILSSDKLRQCTVQFACRTATRQDLSNSERKALKDVLEASDRERTYFQKYEEKSQPGSFQVFKEYPIGAVTATAPSFVLDNTSITLLKPVRIGDQTFINISTEMNELNREMAGILTQVQTVVKSIQYQRAGKIFEFQLGPYTPEEKRALFANLVVYDLSDLSELNIIFTRHIKEGDQVFNALTHIGFRQLKLEDQFMLNIRIDINNRSLRNSMEAPAQVIQVWSKADSLINAQLDSILN